MPVIQQRVSDSEDAEAVRELEAVWDRLCPPLGDEEREAFQSLVRKWEPLRSRDPIVIDCDLLSPLGQEFRETSHTQALGYLLDSSGGHGLGAGPFKDFLSFVDSLLEESEYRAFAAATSDVRDSAVLLERSAIAGTSAEDPDDELLCRTDLWLEIPRTEPRALVVVEAKIHTVARRAQLDMYDQLIAERLRAVGKPIPVVKIYLTPWGDSPPGEAGGSGWIAGSMLQMAALMLPALDKSEGPGAEFLRLYLATLLQRVLGLRWSENAGRARQRDLAAYLALRLEGAP